MKYYIFFVIPYILVLSACTKQSQPTISENDPIGVNNILYQNSFETQQDTSGLEGYCSTYLIDDAPFDGGDQCISVSCGCIGPYARMSVGPFSDDNKVVLTCWAKGFKASGNVSLSYSFQDYINLPIPRDSTWQFYQSIDTLFCPSGEVLKIGMSAGGFASGQILVDLLTILKVD